MRLYGMDASLETHVLTPFSIAPPRVARKSVLSAFAPWPEKSVLKAANLQAVKAT
jgi:hypothetical protein